MGKRRHLGDMYRPAGCALRRFRWERLMAHTLRVDMALLLVAGAFDVGEAALVNVPCLTVLAQVVVLNRPSPIVMN